MKSALESALRARMPRTSGASTSARGEQKGFKAAQDEHVASIQDATYRTTNTLYDRTTEARCVKWHRPPDVLGLHTRESKRRPMPIQKVVTEGKGE